MLQIIFRGLLTKKYRYIFDFQVKISTILMNANHKKHQCMLFLTCY